MNPWARLKAAAEVIVSSGGLLTRPHFTELREALAALPAAAPSEAPLLDAVKAWAAADIDDGGSMKDFACIIAAAEARQAAKP